MTKEQNDELTRIGPGTPMGDVLRHYWYPVALVRELEEFPVKKARLLGEDFAVFKLPDGTYGITHERCPHRGASLVYGIVEDGGLRCGYHGWKFDADGKCVDILAEPDSSPAFRDRVCVRAGKAQALGGLVWAYIGDDPAPELPRVRGLCDGRCPRHRAFDAAVQLVADHGERRRPVPRRGVARELLRLHRRVDGLRDALFVQEQARQGRLRSRSSTGSSSAASSSVRPRTTTTGRSVTRWSSRTRCGSAETACSRCRSVCRSTTPTRGCSSTPCTRPRAPSCPSRCTRSTTSTSGVDEQGNHIVDYIEGQDIMAWVTQGPIADRTTENITKSDVGVVAAAAHVPRLHRCRAPGPRSGRSRARPARRDHASARALEVRARRRVRHAMDRSRLDALLPAGRRPQEAAHPGVGELQAQTAAAARYGHAPATPGTSMTTSTTTPGRSTCRRLPTSGREVPGHRRPDRRALDRGRLPHPGHVDRRTAAAAVTRWPAPSSG